MKLTIHERYILLRMLPGEGNLGTLRLLRQLRERLSFSEEEYAAFAIKENSGSVNWDGSPAAKEISQAAVKAGRPMTPAERRDFDQIDQREIVIGPKGMAIIVETLKKMDTENRMPLDATSVAEKFLSAPEDGLDPEPSQHANNGDMPAAIADRLAASIPQSA